MGELLAEVLARRRHVVMRVGKLGRLHDLSCGIADFPRVAVEDHFPQGLAGLDVGTADLDLGILRIVFVGDFGEISGQLPMLILRPTLERMVVALVAIEPHAEEKLRRVFHQVARIAEHLEIRSGRVLDV